MGESIIIGDNVVLSVVEINGNRVRLGLTAPKEVSIHRQEIYDAIKREQAADAAERQDE